MAKPLLSIGMIFKNDARSLERCLEALRPLREAVPCELVMADTGSSDGSREIAERYADVLFDFPWVDDFSAARNAVMDRSSGAWFFTVDSDEYLDGDISELTDFLEKNGGQTDFGMVNQRSYFTYEMDGTFADFMAVRLLRMSTGLRYEGTIHEKWPLGTRAAKAMPRTILHHDGYVDLHDEMGRTKRERNQRLLKKELEKDPENLQIHLQLIESSEPEDVIDRVRRAMALVEQEVPGWKLYGPPIFRYAVVNANDRGLPEFWDWAEKAWSRFPDSPFTQLDVQFVSCNRSRREDRYQQCVTQGEAWMSAWREYQRGGVSSVMAQMISGVITAGPRWEQEIKLMLADAHRALGHLDQALDLLKTLNFSLLDENMTARMARVLERLHRTTEADTAPVVREAWRGIAVPSPSPAWAEKRKIAFMQALLPAFAASVREEEANQADFRRHGYTLLLPLRELCDFGRAAALLDEEEPEAVLAEIENWDEIPTEAILAALGRGGRFPPPERPLNLEEMDLLAARLARQEDVVFDLARQAAERGWTDTQELAWARALTLAAVGVCQWEDEPRGMALCRQFYDVERAFLPSCYAQQALTEDGSFLLPPLHRFGWYYVRAFTALDSGRPAEYVRLLRNGLLACESVKPMVKFLTAHTPEIQGPSAEMLSLAKQIRTILLRFPPDDPSVAALRQSEAYQKVAFLIEEEDKLMLEVDTQS